MSESLLTADVRHEIDKWMTRYPADQKRSAILEALRLAQEQNDGYLSEPIMNAVADYLELPHIAVYEVATFYSLYNLKPVGKHVIYVCTNISCMLNGSEQVVKDFEKKLKIKVGETTTDGQFTLKEEECLAACANAPMCLIGRKYYENLTSEKIDGIIDTLRHPGK